MTAKTFEITNDQGRTFRVRIIGHGEKYGRSNACTNVKPDPMIEFWDVSPAIVANPGFGPEGQCVSRYAASTIAAHRDHQGIALDGAIDVWRIDANALAPVLRLARAIFVHDPNSWGSKDDHARLAAYVAERERTRTIEDQLAKGPGL